MWEAITITGMTTITTAGMAKIAKEMANVATTAVTRELTTAVGKEPCQL